MTTNPKKNMTSYRLPQSVSFADYPTSIVSLFRDRFSCSTGQVAAMEETASVINGERSVDALVSDVFRQTMSDT